jgi:hypothetical protein
MNRRALLQCAGVVGAALLAGCSSSGGPGEGPTDEPPTDGGEPSQSPVLADTEFVVDAQSSGTQRDEATVQFDGQRVVVDGVVWGSDGCKTATLLHSAYDPETNTHTVTVGTTDRADAGEMCTQAIVEIEYTATATFEGGLPGRVVVRHDHGDGSEQVADAER